jgi:hypothetical protein
MGTLASCVVVDPQEYACFINGTFRKIGNYGMTAARNLYVFLFDSNV